MSASVSVMQTKRGWVGGEQATYMYVYSKGGDVIEVLQPKHEKWKNNCPVSQAQPGSFTDCC